MASELLCVFKSSRRTEYTQENLHVLSDAVDEELEVSYKDRWLSDDVRHRLPQAGEAALVVLADPPYSKSHPIRRAQVVAAESSDDSLRIRLRLGPRVMTDQNRWKPLVSEADNPENGQFALRLAVEDGVVEELADAESELRAWKRQVDSVSHADGYARVTFLRVGGISEVGGPLLPAPFRLASRRTYQVNVIAYNPHLDESTLAALRLVAFPDPALVDVVMDAQPIPADGVVELALVPQDEGVASLEFNVSRGAEFWYALQLDWQTIPAAVPVIAETDVIEHPAVSAEVAARSSDESGISLLRAYKLLRDDTSVPAALRLSVLDELLRASPGHERLLEQRGIVLYDVGRWADAAATLDGLTAGVLGAEGRTTLVASWFQQGRLPDPIDRVRIADFARDSWFELLLEASGQLSPADQVVVARELGSSVLTEDRASRWISPLAMDPDLPRRDRLDLLLIWQLADPVAAAAGVEALVESGVIDLAEPAFATYSFELAMESRRTGLARRSAFALITHYEDRRDVEALEGLLDEVMRKLVRSDRRELGEEIVLAIADLADDDAEIDRALDAAADLIEDQRQRGDLDAAARLATFADANVNRASKRVRQRLKAVRAELDKAFEHSDSIRRYQRVRRRELNEDLKDFVGGKRVLVVGANEQPWWPDVRAEFGFDINSEWVSTERRKAPNLDRLIKKLDKVDLLVVQTGRIGHKTSEPLMKAAKERNLQTLSVPRPTRDALTMSFRGLERPEPSSTVRRPGMDLDSIIG